MRTARLALLALLVTAACAPHAPRTLAAPKAITTEGSRLAVPGGAIWYRVVGGGRGTPLILLHGGPGLPSVYLKSLEALGDERVVVRYDQLGGGYSDGVKDTSLFSIGHFVQELDSLRAHLGLERVHVYGHSWGSILALEYYRAHPEHVASLVLASPVLDMQAFFGNQRRLMAALSASAYRAAQLEEAGQPFDTAAFRAGTKEYMRRYSQHQFPPADADSMRRLLNPAVTTHLNGSSMFAPNGLLKDYDATGFLKSVRVPVLYVVGDSDFAGPQIARRFAGVTPRARFVAIAGSGHMMMWDKPAENVAAVRSFLREVDRR